MGNKNARPSSVSAQPYTVVDCSPEWLVVEHDVMFQDFWIVPMPTVSLVLEASLREESSVQERHPATPDPQDPPETISDPPQNEEAPTIEEPATVLTTLEGALSPREPTFVPADDHTGSEPSVISHPSFEELHYKEGPMEDVPPPRKDEPTATQFHIVPTVSLRSESNQPVAPASLHYEGDQPVAPASLHCEGDQPVAPASLHSESDQPTAPASLRSDSDLDPKLKPIKEDSLQSVKEPQLQDTIGQSGEAGAFVCRCVRQRYVELTKEVGRDPQRVAEHLFEQGLITEAELRDAANPYPKVMERAAPLAGVFFNCDVNKHFKTILRAFEAAGVEVATKILDDVRERFPCEFQEEDQSRAVQQPDDILVNVDKALKKVSVLLKESRPSCAEQYIHGQLEKPVQNLLLHAACQVSADLDTFNTVLVTTDKDGIDYTNENLHYRTPLHIACSHLPSAMDADSTLPLLQQKTKIANLLKHRADCSLKDKDGNTPLHVATLRGSAECVRLILSHDRSCRDIGNKLGNTALHIACRNNFVEIVRVLCDHKADARLSNLTRKRRSPLHEAVSEKWEDAVDLVLDYEPSTVDCTDKKCMRPLHLACKRRSVPIVKSLLKQKHCLVFIVDKTERTPLHYACYWGNKELVKLLLRQNNSRDFVNHKDCYGETALHIARRHGDKKVIKLLRSNHASDKVANQCGKTPKEVVMAPSDGDGIPTKRRKLRHGSSQPELSPADSWMSLVSAVSTVSSRTDSTNSAKELNSSDESNLDETI